MMNNNKERILYFCSSSVFGGAERFVDTCMGSHKEFRDYEATLFFLNRGHFYQHCLSKYSNVDIGPFTVRLVNVFSWILFQFYFYFYLKRNKIDIIHLTMPYSQVFASLPATFAGVRTIWFQHGPVGGHLDKLANILPYDYVFFNSNFTRNEHLLTVGKIKSPDYIVNMKVRTDFNVKEVEKLQGKYSSEDGLFVCTGRICRWKGFEHAIKAIQLLKSEKSLNCHLLIIGMPSNDDDKDYYQYLIDLVQKDNLEGQITFLGFKDNVFDYVKACDAVFHTSLTAEPFGLVIAEAMSLNTFVFVTDMGGAAEQIKQSPLSGIIYGGDCLGESLYLSLNENWNFDKRRPYLEISGDQNKLQSGDKNVKMMMSGMKKFLDQMRGV